MCLGGKPSAPPDNSAEIARQQEAERQARISAGTSRINENFSRFDESWYSGLGRSFLDYFSPQLDRQYEDAQKQLTYSFADRGAVESGAANQKFADLQRAYGEQRSQLSERALNAQQGGRADVERNRADLIAGLEAGSGVESTATSALARANSLSAPREFSPLGAVFSEITSALGNSAVLQGQGRAGLPFTSSPPLLGSRGSSSSVKSVGG